MTLVQATAAAPDLTLLPLSASCPVVHSAAIIFDILRRFPLEDFFPFRFVSREPAEGALGVQSSETRLHSPPLVIFPSHSLDSLIAPVHSWILKNKKIKKKGKNKIKIPCI
jgi:hypothetical protein